MSEILVHGGTAVSSVTHRYVEDGTESWTADHGATVYGVAAGSDGRCYVVGDFAGASPPYTYLRVYDRTGTELWTASHGATLYCVAVDANGNVYVGGDNTGTVTTRKYNSSGVEQWTANHGAAVYGITADASGNVYTVGYRTSSVMTRKYDSSGTLTWSKDRAGSSCSEMYAVAVDGSGNVYECGNNSYFCKRDSSGTSSWYKTSAYANARGIAVDADGNVYVACGYASGGSSNLYKYNSSGTKQWDDKALNGYQLYALTLDTLNDYFYVCGTRYNSKTWEKWNLTGSKQSDGDHGDTQYGIYWALGATVKIIPALGLPLYLKAPFPTAIVSLPGLALPIYLKAPAAVTPAPPDLTDRPSVIYRAFLTSGDALIELPLLGLQAGRRAGDSSWLTVTCPYSAAIKAYASAAVGEELVVTAGYLDGSTETSGIFLRSTIDGYRYLREVQSGNVEVVARVVEPARATSARTLIGVRSLRREAGRYRIDCDLDPSLGPGDTATFDAISLIVGTVSYRIDANGVVMTVEEAA